MKPIAKHNFVCVCIAAHKKRLKFTVWRNSFDQQIFFYIFLFHDLIIFFSRSSATIDSNCKLGEFYVDD